MCLVPHRENGPIIGAIDWHSYSQLILRPWGWSQLAELSVTSSVVVASIANKVESAQQSHLCVFFGLYHLMQVTRGIMLQMNPS